MRLGADPEVFMRNKDGLVSVIGLIHGDKWNPMQVEGLPKGFTLQQDNVALEFGIPPAASKQEFVDYIKTVKKAGKSYLKGLSFSYDSCAIFPADQMQTAEAHIFGCEPDFNAWTHKENPPPKPPHEFMRSAGGHVHVETTLPAEQVVRNMDLFVGVGSVLMDKTGTQRRELYGKAGAYRKKSYGVEYRTLSNFWIFEDKLIKWVWDETAKALSALRDGYVCNDPLIRECIDKGDKDMASLLVHRYNLKVV